MSALSNGRVLRIALVASLAVHLVFAAAVHSQPVTAAPEQKPQRTAIVKLQPPPLPTPTPKPPPPKPMLPQPARKTVAAHPRTRTLHVPARVHPRGPAAAPPAEPTGNPLPPSSPGPDTAPTGAPFVPTPMPTPKPACSAPDVPARTLVTQSAVTPDDAAGFTGTAKVRVDLDASGKVVGASIYESTGSMELDQAALAAARASRYAAEERDCKNVPGSYLFVVDFE